MNRVPTLEEYLSHDGLHYHVMWREVGEDWSCPACGRTKFQIMRWTTRNPNSPNAFKDWVAALAKHHDHSIGFFEPGEPRFQQTVICAQCNVADGQAKRKLGLPPKFSFSPAELRRFIVATPHGKHAINYEIASSIYLMQFLPPSERE